MVYFTRRFVYVLPCVILFLCFFSPFSIAITSLWAERANLSAFRTFVRFVLVWFCLFPLPLGVWEGLRFVIVALPGTFLLLFFFFFFFFFFFITAYEVSIKSKLPFSVCTCNQFFVSKGFLLVNLPRLCLIYA